MRADTIPVAPTREIKETAAESGSATATVAGRVSDAFANRLALVRIGFGVIWAIDAWYKWQPAFQRQFAGMFARQVKTAPAALQPWFQFWAHLVTPHAAFFGIATAITETLIAVFLILGIARRPLYLLGALFSFMVWAVPESFGRFWTTGQTDLGTGIMYVFIFVALYLLESSIASSWSIGRVTASTIFGQRNAARGHG